MSSPPLRRLNLQIYDRFADTAFGVDLVGHDLLTCEILTGVAQTTGQIISTTSADCLRNP